MPLLPTVYHIILYYVDLKEEMYASSVQFTLLCSLLNPKNYYSATPERVYWAIISRMFLLLLSFQQIRQYSSNIALAL